MAAWAFLGCVLLAYTTLAGPAHHLELHGLWPCSTWGWNVSSAESSRSRGGQDGEVGRLAWEARNLCSGASSDPLSGSGSHRSSEYSN